MPGHKTSQFLTLHLLVNSAITKSACDLFGPPRVRVSVLPADKAVRGSLLERLSPSVTMKTLLSSGVTAVLTGQQSHSLAV